MVSLAVARTIQNQHAATQMFWRVIKGAAVDWRSAGSLQLQSQIKNEDAHITVLLNLQASSASGTAGT